MVVIGAGLAGLSCARRLHERGLQALVLEAQETIGGRVQSDRLDGFILDRGFHVLLTAYPEVVDVLDLGKLELRPFTPGFFLRKAGALHEFDASSPIKVLASDVLSTADRLNLIDWTLDCRGLSYPQIERLPEMTAERSFRRAGFSNAFLYDFARPFLGSVFLDPSLSMSNRVVAATWKAFSEGRAVLPAAGMSAIAAQMGSGLDVRTGCRVGRLEGGRRVQAVRLSSGDVIEAESVVVATESPEAERLSGFSTPLEARGQTCLYFEAPESPLEGGKITISAQPSLVQVVATISDVAPERAPPGRTLVAVTTSGMPSESDPDLSEAVKAELRGWFPETNVLGWRFLRSYRISFAQFAQAPGFAASLPSNTPGRDGLYFAGEFTVGSSIQGALQSGRQCADLVLQDLLGAAA